ncbi:MAG TPA: hypothetical protein VFF06_05275 [Polyangia bacterium]|nr:hypothetical protein [Polyangia bacterium]
MRSLAFALTVLALSPSPARAGATGSMIITAEQIDTTGKFEAEAKKKAVKVLKGSNDSWQLYFIAWLKHTPGTSELNLVFYDQADKAHDPVNAFPISTQANAKILVSNVSFGTDQGFKAGHTYDVMLARLVGGKEDVFARTTLTLK